MTEQTPPATDTTDPDPTIEPEQAEQSVEAPPAPVEPAAAEVAPEAEAAEAVTESEVAEATPASAEVPPEPEAAEATPSSAEVPREPEAAEAAPAGAEPPAVEASPAPSAAPKPRPVPRPAPIPSPAAVRKVAHAQPALTPPAPSGPPSETFGRVAEDGTVLVRTGDGEREVGAYPGASPEEALHYFARKYDELYASVDLLLQRVTSTDLPAKEAADGLAKLREHTAEANVVGDLGALDAKIAEIAAAVAARKSAEAAERSAARTAAASERERIVAEAEQISGQPESKIQWKQSGARMRALLDEWKNHQRNGARLDRETEGALWQRFSHARNAFDKARRVHFAQLEGTQAEAKAAKQELVKEAEALATSTDWGSTAGSFKRLMDRWRQAGRASRSDDDALWERFKAAQDAFFTAKDAVAAREDEEFRGNLAVKQELLKEAEAILPVTDLEAAKSALRSVQDRWEAAGKVPRGDIERMEKGMRRVEQAVRDADDQRWKKSNPEVAARAQSMVVQLEASVASLQADLEKARAAGNDKLLKEAQSKLEAQEQWLSQARGNVDEFGG